MNHLFNDFNIFAISNNMYESFMCIENHETSNRSCGYRYMPSVGVNGKLGDGVYSYVKAKVP